jgi:hypothetical protein
MLLKVTAFQMLVSLNFLGVALAFYCLEFIHPYNQHSLLIYRITATMSQNRYRLLQSPLHKCEDVWHTPCARLPEANDRTIGCVLPLESCDLRTCRHYTKFLPHLLRLYIIH